MASHDSEDLAALLDAQLDAAREITQCPTKRTAIIAPEYSPAEFIVEDEFERARRAGKRGFALIELMIACVVLFTLLALAVPNAIQMRNSNAQQAAKTRLLSAWQAQGLLQSCAFLYGAADSRCAGLLATVPQPGTVSTPLYNYTWTSADGVNFTYTAVPVAPGLHGYSITNAGQLVQQ